MKSIDRVHKFLRYLLLAGAVLYVFVYLFVVLSRIQYPFVLEWIEGGMLEQVKRILAGHKVYVKPSMDFITFIYTPLYLYVSALLSIILGVGFTSLRFVSFLSSLGCFLTIYFFVRRETGSNFSGLLASCLFAATYRIGGAWFDIARNDSLFLFLLLIALYLVKFGQSAKSYFLAGLFISLSFLTKQTALVVSLPLMLYCVYLSRRYAVYFIATTTLIIGGSTLILNHIYEGWYYYYVFDLPGQRPDPLLKEMYAGFWVEDLMSPLPVAFVMSIFYILAQVPSSNKRNFVFYLLSAVGMIGSAWIIRLHDGGYNNVLFPAYAIISILFGLALHTFLTSIQSTSKQRLLEIFIYLLCIIQFFFLKYNPLLQIPSQADLEAGTKFSNAIARIEGEIYIPCCDYFSALVGKKSYAHLVPTDDIILKGAEGPIRNNIINEITRSIQEKRFSAVIIDTHPWFFTEFLEKYYTKQGPVFDSKDVFWPVTGMKTRPEFVYLPKSDNNF